MKVVWKQNADFMDGSGLHFVKFYFKRDSPEVKLAILINL